jgi:hypothetical protein
MPRPLACPHRRAQPGAFALTAPACHTGLTVPAIELHVHLLELPAPVAKCSHPTYTLPAYVGRKQRSEPVPPVPHGLMANVGTPLEQQILYIAQRQRKRAYIMTTRRITSGEE